MDFTPKGYTSITPLSCAWLQILSNNLLLGSSITKSGLHRGPNTRYILYNDTIKIYKLELKPK